MFVSKKLDYSQITKQLYVGRTPSQKNIDQLANLGITLLINMRIEKPLRVNHRTGDLDVMWLPSFDNRYLPIKPNKLVPVVERSLKVLQSGGSIYVGCRRGRHRSAVMAAAILIASGYTIEDALKLLKERRLVIDTNKPHIKRAIVNFADYWHKQNVI